MAGILAPRATTLGAVLSRETNKRGGPPSSRQDWPWNLLKRRHEFGITRVAAITRLDRIGLPVVQVTRPLSLSNVVSQGKGLTPGEAIASALMESLETWAAERVPRSSVQFRTARSLGDQVVARFATCTVAESGTAWPDVELFWIDGYDLFTSNVEPVPLGLVDTVYTWPSPHPRLFPRVTTGLGAGSTWAGAIVHAGMEILERHALAGAENIPHFFDRFQVELSTVTAEVANRTLQQVTAAGFLVGAWRVPALHGLPIYLCHVMESGRHPELAPLPADGSACHFSHGKALVGALLEACQGRLAAISGAREDITRGLYPSQFDREHLAVWRGQLQSPGRISFPSETGERQDEMAALPMISDALAQAGANSAYVVPLFGDDAASLYVVRLVAPPLLTTPRSSS